MQKFYGSKGGGKLCAHFMITITIIAMAYNVTGGYYRGLSSNVKCKYREGNTHCSGKGGNMDPADVWGRCGADVSDFGYAEGYEKEWRIIIPADQYKEKNEVHFIRDFDCISKIFLGYRIDKVKREHILEIIVRKNDNRPTEAKIEVFDTKLGGDSYKLIPVKVI